MPRSFHMVSGLSKTRNKLYDFGLRVLLRARDPVLNDMCTRSRCVRQGLCMLSGTKLDIKGKEQWAYLSTHPSKRLTSFCYDDDDDDDSAITPILSTEEPIDSLIMGDEHLDTIPATESDELIKSSVDDLIPIPSEFEGIPDTMCDVHLDNNHTPLEAKDHLEIVLNSNDDISSSDDDSLHEENI
nr:hypothetical protein [Tanacetum cinerariifolium]